MVNKDDIYKYLEEKEPKREVPKKALTFRITDAEKYHLERMAEIKGISQSDYLRRLIDADIRRVEEQVKEKLGE